MSPPIEWRIAQVRPLAFLAYGLLCLSLRAQDSKTCGRLWPAPDASDQDEVDAYLQQKAPPRGLWVFRFQKDRKPQVRTPSGTWTALVREPLNEGWDWLNLLPTEQVEGMYKRGFLDVSFRPSRPCQRLGDWEFFQDWFPSFGVPTPWTCFHFFIARNKTTHTWSAGTLKGQIERKIALGDDGSLRVPILLTPRKSKVLIFRIRGGEVTRTIEWCGSCIFFIPFIPFIPVNHLFP